VTDHFQSRTEFGTTLQLKALIEAAHAHGLRVLIDFVPNHLATAHPYYIDADRHRQRSPISIGSSVTMKVRSRTISTGRT
jgi:alpha-glucosidase